MARQTPNDIDRALAEWRQGDCVLGELGFVHLLDPECPLTPVEETEGVEQTELVVEPPVPGLCVITQTCDIARPCKDRPYLEVAPLMPVSDQELHEIERGYRPAYAYVPGVADRNLVAHLERVMTVEKAVLAKWRRTLGCRNDDERRQLTLALQRKWGRTAFPDDFAGLVSQLQKRIRNKHDRQSDEGRALRALREIRVTASPSWDDGEISLLFWFIHHQDQLEFGGKTWDHWVGRRLALVPAGERYMSVEGQAATLDDMTADEYVHSDPLDLDFLSSRPS